MASPALDDCFLRELAVPDFLLRPVLPKAGDGPPDATGPPLLDSSAATGVEAMTRGWETMKISASPGFLVFLACAFRFEVGKSCCARPASRDPFSNLNHSRSFLPKATKIEWLCAFGVLGIRMKAHAWAAGWEVLPR